MNTVPICIFIKCLPFISCSDHNKFFISTNIHHLSNYNTVKYSSYAPVLSALFHFTPSHISCFRITKIFGKMFIHNYHVIHLWTQDKSNGGYIMFLNISNSIFILSETEHMNSFLANFVVWQNIHLHNEIT